MDPDTSPPAVVSGIPVRLFEHQAAWDAWLDANAASSAGLWLRLAKKSASLRSLTYDEAVETALCHGWIDSQKRAYDAGSWIQKFTPRGPTSIWSKINRAKAEALIAQGRMRPAGLAAVDRARSNGRWDAAYDSHATAAPPADFLAALDANPAAKACYTRLSSQNRYAVLFRIQTARRDATRQKRIAQLVEMLARGETLYP
ncbi:bacteriocin-protection protein [bacterium]|nr:bacteriocin-protection protein [Chloroflexi bacterium CFX6]RIL11285.1 MAG: bacteriocin-protection protein [bacterium]